MFRWIIGKSLRLRFIVIALAGLMCLSGYMGLRKMSVDVFPEFAPPIVEIQTISLGMSPLEVEELVTIPLEEALAGIPGLDTLRSKSVEQLSAIKLYFKRSVDLLHARQLVQERIDLVAPSLPSWASPPYMLQPLSATSRVMKIGVSSDKYSVIDLSMIGYWKIRARLLRVPGVANIAMWGERLRMMQVQVDPRRLFREGVPLSNVMKSTADALEVGLLPYSPGAIIGTGGFIETANQRLGIKHEFAVPSVVELSEVVVHVDETGKAVRLKDIADVVEDHQPMIGDGIVNDDIGLLLIVEKFPWANTLDVTRGVEDALKALKPALSDIEFDSEIFRPATFIEMSIDNLSRALFYGSLLVIIVIGAFLFEWRVALISIIAIPLSLMAAVLALFLVGGTMNTMILAGLIIALGTVVDDAIIDMENIVRRLREAGERVSAGRIRQIVLDASVEIRSPIVFATLIIVTAVIPVLFLDGLSGSFFKPLILAYILAIGASLVVAMTITPALCLLLLGRRQIGNKQPPLASFLQDQYEKVIVRIIRRPKLAMSSAGLLAAAGLIAYPFLGHELLPSFKERDFLMHWVTTPGTSHPEMNRITIASSKELRAIPGVKNFGAHIGQAFLMDEVVGVHFGENWVSVDPSVSYEETQQEIQRVVDEYPGLYRDVLTYLKERIREVLSGGSEAIVIRLYGSNLDILQTKAQEIRERISKIKGTVDVHVDLQRDIPQIEITSKLKSLAKYGLKPGDIRRTVSYLVAGHEVGDVYENGETYDVQVWTVPEVRQSLTDIQNLLIDTPNNGVVRLMDVAEVAIRPTPNVIQREAFSRYIDIESNVSGVGLSTVANQVEDIIREIDYPLGYRAVLQGEYAELSRSRERLMTTAVVAMLIIFALLHVSFGSVRLATLAMAALPIAFVGGVFAMFMINGIVSLGALVGFLTVLGIAARNGILLLTHYQHLQVHENMEFGQELILRGARERLMPILMTALTTAIALVPLLIAGEVPGHEIEFPMAVVIVGGIFTSTIVNLFVMPALFAYFGKPEEALGSYQPA